MAHITCAISSIQFTCSQFNSLNIGNKTCYHPIFTLPQKQLLALVNNYLADHLTLSEQEVYLLYIALLKSTELVAIQSPCLPSDRAYAIAVNNIESLASVIPALNSIPQKSFNPPNVIISKTNDSNNLTASPQWISLWEDSVADWNARYIDSVKRNKKANLDEAIASIKLSAPDNPIKHAKSLAEWASIAGQFPKELTCYNVTASKPKDMLVSDYWKSLIKRCVKSENIFTMDSGDLEDLIEYCEDFIPHGSTSATQLMKTLRNTHSKLLDILGIGISNGGGNTKFSILDTTDNDANSNEAIALTAIITNAPTVEPKECDYPNKFAFIRAKMAFGIAKRQQAELAEIKSPLGGKL